MPYNITWSVKVHGKLRNEFKIGSNYAPKWHYYLAVQTSLNFIRKRTTAFPSQPETELVGDFRSGRMRQRYHPCMFVRNAATRFEYFQWHLQNTGAQSAYSVMDSDYTSRTYFVAGYIDERKRCRNKNHSFTFYILFLTLTHQLH
jgi:hypothetical protein